MGASQIERQGSLGVNPAFSYLRLVVINKVVNPDKLRNRSADDRSILTTSNGSRPFPQHVVPTLMHVLHGGCKGLVIEHIKYFTKILWFICRASITNKEKHHRIRMVLGLDVLVHPYLT
ncbi:AC5 protein [Bhendi yellow vein India virus [India:Srinivaspur OYSK2:2006]]|nr:AC5 protein [Bhendi yellow vein India virus [India:Srinivaspur OYSK2:2006]]